jgi:hypothetical protein
MPVATTTYVDRKGGDGVGRRSAVAQRHADRDHVARRHVDKRRGRAEGKIVEQLGRSGVDIDRRRRRIVDNLDTGSGGLRLQYECRKNEKDKRKNKTVHN